MKNTLLALLTALMFAFPAFAQEAASTKAPPAKAHHDASTDMLGKCRALLMTAPPKEDCMLESAKIEVHFNSSSTKSFTDARAEFDKIIKQVTELAAQQKVGKIRLNSVRYNFHPEKVEIENVQAVPTFHVDGVAFFFVESVSDAYRFSEFLIKKNFNVTMDIRQPCDTAHKDAADDNTTAETPTP